MYRFETFFIFSILQRHGGACTYKTRFYYSNTDNNSHYIVSFNGIESDTCLKFFFIEWLYQRRYRISYTSPVLLGGKKWNSTCSFVRGPSKSVWTSRAMTHPRQGATGLSPQKLFIHIQICSRIFRLCQFL